MVLLKKILKKIQAYQDKRFLVRLERILRSNAINSNLILRGNVFTEGTIQAYMSKDELKEALKGNHLDPSSKCFHQEHLEKQVPVQSD